MALSSTMSLAKAIIALILVPLLVIIFYRLYLHPLSKYPGPLLGRCSDIWAVYHGWKGDLTQSLELLHRKHGEFVRFGLNKVSANSTEAIDAVYGFKANTRKARFYYTFAVDPVHPSTHTVIDKAVHARKRRVVSQGLSSKAIKALEPGVIDSVDVLRTQLLSNPGDDGWSSPKDMAEWASYLTVDVMGAMVFSKRFGLMEGTEKRWLKDAVPIASRNKYACGFMPWLLLSGFDTIMWPKLTDYRIRLKAFSIDQLQQRFARKDDESLQDIFHFFMKATDPETGEKFTQRELGSEANLMIAAGSDTTSTAIASTFFFLMRHREVLAKATKEVREQFPSLEAVRPGTDLSACTYLRACLDESMRLAPPVPGALLREALTGGVRIKDEHFPPGTDLAVPAFVIHRNEKYYPSPLSYRPERWLGEKSDAQAAFCPFSLGPRNCVGRGMAYMEMTVAVARILWSMDLRLVNDDQTGVDHDGTYILLDGFVAEKWGPMVQCRRRQ